MASTAFQTDLLFPRFDGEVSAREGYTAVHTPSNPGFYWGNFLLMPSPPAAGDLARWEQAFEREFGHRPGVQHRSFGLDTGDGERGDVQPFVDAGYELIDDAVLELRRLAAPVGLDGIKCRRLETDAEWQAWHALNRDSDPLDGKGDGYAAFKAALRDRYQAMVNDDRGHWWGAFDGERLVGSLGLFDAPNLDAARFQAVETHPDYRRRGIATHLVAAACADTLQRGTQRLLIVANQDSSAYRIYQRLGFEEIERQLGLCRGPT